MRAADQYIKINNSNIPVLESCQSLAAYGQYVSPAVDESNMYSASLMAVEAKDMYLPNFSFRITQGRFGRDAVLFNESGKDSDHLGSCLLLKGSVKSVLPKHRNTVVSHCRTQNFKFDPNNEYQHIIPANDPFQLIHFSFRPAFLHQFLPENERWAELLKERIERKERILGNRVSPITLAQDHALQNIFNPPLSGKLGLMMIETSIIQIILLQLNFLFNDAESREYATAQREISIVRELREYLEQNFLDDQSLTQLSRHAGMNSNKLMIVFKKVFGQSIFEYIGDLRMEHARKLLMEKDVLVTEVAGTVGYKNPNHFSAAFKKKYGITPSELRN